MSRKVVILEVQRLEVLVYFVAILVSSTDLSEQRPRQLKLEHGHHARHSY